MKRPAARTEHLEVSVSSRTYWLSVARFTSRRARTFSMNASRSVFGAAAFAWAAGGAAGACAATGTEGLAASSTQGRRGNGRYTWASGRAGLAAG